MSDDASRDGDDESRDETPRPPPPAAGREERVRFCAGCGEVVPFEERTCPSCGHYEAVEAPASSPVVSSECAACGATLSSLLLFCPRCGVEQYPGDLPAATSNGAGATADAGAARLHVLGIVLALVGPLAVLAAVALLYFSAAA